MAWQTHTVFNQPAPLMNSNLFLSDSALREAVTREGAGWDSDLLASIGQQLGAAESLELGRLANSNPPELLRYDATGMDNYTLADLVEKNQPLYKLLLVE